MDSENVALVRRVYEVFNRLGSDPSARAALMELFADDVDYVQVGGPPDAGSFGGRRSMEQVWGEWLSIWREHRSTIEEVRERGDRVLVLSHERLFPREGMEIENEGAAIFTIRGGKVVRLEGFTEQPAAIEAFGA